MSKQSDPLDNGKWEIVAQNLANGASNYKACQIAGYKEGHSLPFNASKICKYPQIQKRVLELKEEMCTDYILNRNDLLITLGQIIKKGTDPNKIKAVNLSAQLQGLLTNTTNINVHKSAADLTDEELLSIISSKQTDEEDALDKEEAYVKKELEEIQTGVDDLAADLEELFNDSDINHSTKDSGVIND